MNWKYQLGRMWSAQKQGILRSSWFPLIGAIQWGTVWPYDVMRLAGTRRLGTILDVGANIGQTAKLLHRFFPRATIHSFEPVPSTYATLRQNVVRLAGVRAHAVALGATDGHARMTAAADAETNAIVTTALAAETCTVPMRTLDGFCRDHGIDRIDILKIDVEGHELQVLAGAADLLQTGRIQCVYAEVGFEEGDAQHTLFDDVRAKLDHHGFGFSGLYEPWRYWGERGRIGFANALFWNRGKRSPEKPAK